MQSLTDDYLETKVATATQHQLHLLVVDGAIRYALAAESALERRKFDEAGEALAQARRFVGELLSGLDASRLPELVDRLKALFLFVHHSFVTAGLRHDSRLVHDAIVVLRMHRDTWLALGERLKEEAATKATPESENRYSWAS